jgi:hypothetical protein
MNFYEKYVFDYLPCKEEMELWLNEMKDEWKMKWRMKLNDKYIK